MMEEFVLSTVEHLDPNQVSWLNFQVFVDNNPPADKTEEGETKYMYSSPDEVRNLVLLKPACFT
jgi:hypothetical protein